MVENYYAGAPLRVVAGRGMAVVFAAVSIVATLGAFRIAQAAEPFAPRQVSVNYDDLNLSSDSDSRVMYSRLKSAARAVCAGLPSSQKLQNSRVREHCYAQSLTHAVDTLGIETVASLHRAATSSRVAGQSTHDSSAR